MDIHLSHLQHIFVYRKIIDLLVKSNNHTNTEHIQKIMAMIPLVQPGDTDYDGSQMFEELRPEHCTNIGSVSGRLAETAWTDEIFNKDYWAPASTLIPKKADRDVLVKNCQKFWAIYFGQDNLEMSEYLKFFLTVFIGMEDKDGKAVFSAGTADFTIASTAVTEVNIFLFQGAARAFNTSGYAYTDKTIKDYYKKVIEVSTGNASDKQEFINKTAFVMLNCVRLIRKAHDNFSHHITESAAKSYESLYGKRLGPDRLPPCDNSFFHQITSAFPRSHIDTRNLLAFLVRSFTSATNPEQTGILRAGCILSLGETGIGLVSWAIKASQALGLDIKTFLKHAVLDTVLKVQISRLITFLKTEPKPRTWPFARLFSDSAYTTLSVRENPQFCVVCALISLQDEDEVANIMQFDSCKGIIPSMIKYAAAIRDAITPDIPSVAITAESRRVIEILQTKPAPTTMRRHKPAADTAMRRQVPQLQEEPANEGEDYEW